MGKPAVSLRFKLISFCAATLLACGFAPLLAVADGSVAGGFTPPESENDARSASPLSYTEGATPNSSASAGNEGSVLASALAGTSAAILSVEVAFEENEPVIGSFTVDGLTYAVSSDGLMFVSVDPGAISDGVAAIPASVAYNGNTYDVTSVAPYAFYLSGATSVELPATITSVDSRAFRSSDVEHVTVDAANPNLASFEGALYSADESRLLLIPEGRKGSVLLSCETEVAEPSVFSHCSLVDAIAVEEGGAAFSSWEGILYNADGTTLLRVPAGAIEITIKDGCTTIAAGALEGCAKLERINAPASVTFISPDVFTPVPTVSLPAPAVLDSSQEVQESAGSDDADVAPMLASGQLETQTAPQDKTPSGAAPALTDQSNASTNSAPQLTAMVALSTINDDLPEMDPSKITVYLDEGLEASCWRVSGMSVSCIEGMTALAKSLSLQDMSSKESKENFTFLWVREDTPVHEVYGSSEDILPDDPTVALPDNFTQYVRVRDTQGYIWYGNGWSTYDMISEVRSDFLRGDYLHLFTSAHSYRVRINDEGHLLPGKLVRGQPDIVSVISGSYDWDACKQYFFSPDYIEWDANADDATELQRVSYAESLGQSIVSPAPERHGYEIEGWYTQPAQGERRCGPGEAVSYSGKEKLYAHWARTDFNLGFDVDSEPGDEDYPGEVKPDEAVNVDDGKVAIEDPKRPGYVFEGWVIPSADGAEAVDQELVYQGDDGQWYVDASKLPDYAGDDARVELTARWTSVISVDVPQSVTFYADTVTQNQGSREGVASSAFGQNKVANQSQVDLRVVGLESEAVKTTDATLGADSILKKAEAATPSTSAGKLLSLYPSAKQWTADELQDPDAVGGAKDANAVDFDLDDILLEKSFASDSFTIPVGDTLNMGYRLNLTETGQQLDYDKLATLEDGQSAAIANVSYCFAADYGMPFWTTDDDGSTLNVLAIKADAEKIAAGDAAAIEKYTRWMSNDHRFYVKWYDQGKTEAQDPEAATIYEVRIIGINHDDKADGSGKAGLTFQFVDCLDMEYPVNSTPSNTGGWGASLLREQMNAASGSIYKQIPAQLNDHIETVGKRYGPDYKLASTRILISEDILFLPTFCEMGSTSESGWRALEGEQYGYWKQGAISVQGGVKKVRGVASYWWSRRLREEVSNKWNGVSAVGQFGSALPNESHGVSPAFCL